jgi:hypothetical protein
MKYEFNFDYIIKIKGKPEQINDWLHEISKFMDKGVSYQMMRKDIPNFDNLGSIVESEKFTFGDVHQVYFRNNMLWYSPNVDEQDKKYHFDRFKKLFDLARPRIDEKYKKNCKTSSKTLNDKVAV